MAPRPVRCATEGQSSFTPTVSGRWWRTRVPQRSDDARASGIRGRRSYVSEPDRGRRQWEDNRDAQMAVYTKRRRIRGDRTSGGIGCAASARALLRNNAIEQLRRRARFANMRSWVCSGRREWSSRSGAHGSRARPEQRRGSQTSFALLRPGLLRPPRHLAQGNDSDAAKIVPSCAQLRAEPLNRVPAEAPWPCHSKKDAGPRGPARWVLDTMRAYFWAIRIGTVTSSLALPSCVRSVFVRAR
jgi:hypothetical protein